MEQVLDISEVARRTGLTARALRFYEARGLLKPMRTASGRRCYDPAALERVNQIVTLKRAGLTLAQIKRLIEQRPPNLARIIEAQLRAVEVRVAELDAARALLLTAKSRVDRGEGVDIDTFCALIRGGGRVMESDDWKKLVEHYFTDEEQATWQEKLPQVSPGFNDDEHAAKWKALFKADRDRHAARPRVGAGTSLRRRMVRAA